MKGFLGTSVLQKDLDELITAADKYRGDHGGNVPLDLWKSIMHLSGTTTSRRIYLYHNQELLLEFRGKDSTPRLNNRYFPTCTLVRLAAGEQPMPTLERLIKTALGTKETMPRINIPTMVRRTRLAGEWVQPQHKCERRWGHLISYTLELTVDEYKAFEAAGFRYAKDLDPSEIVSEDLDFILVIRNNPNWNQKDVMKLMEKGMVL